QVELSNRVIRHHRQYSDRFLRVTFCEENGGRLCFANDIPRLEDYMDRMEGILKDGLELADRHFDLLAFSSGQVREQSAWFWAAPDSGPTAADIRAWMGDFDAIRCVAKFTARMGQCFSSTVDTLKLQAYTVQTVPDVERNGYCFSDGVGRISVELSRAVADRLEQLGRCPAGWLPRAYQIRYAGCKGMVSLHMGLRGKRFEVRPSMNKFEASAQMLEICDYARYVPGYLNRQIVTLLMQKCLGVPNSVFQRLQARTALFNLNKSGQLRCFCLNLIKWGDAAIMLEAAHIIRAGFDVGTEPYLKSILLCLRAHLLQDLKAKTRVRVPKAALLMGVMDEEGVLEPGQVFLSVNSLPTMALPAIVTGTVVVAKNPCFHPGDVRKFQARPLFRSPELHHLVNCLVFPQKGQRPHPDECSGSDLDGDQYFVSWEPGLLFPGPNREPMSFHSQDPVLIPEGQASLVGDVAQFFMDYIFNDLLGIIANAHLATADIKPDGAQCSQCLQLARLHSNAVDFTKSGRPAEFSRDLRPLSYPDFMMKKNKETHESSTIIGQLFRAITVPTPPLLSDIASETQPDPDIMVEGFQQFIPAAQEARTRYEHALVQIMNQYGVHNEAEIVSGCISKFAKHRRKKGDVKTMIIDAVRALRKKNRAEFPGPLAARSRRALQKACAWYHVTYSPAYSGYGPAAALSTRELDARLISFPWILTDHLAVIKTGPRRRLPGQRI
ncbi:RdRP-domain-containing protein, partial [Coccomyxa subellipsoidea C-169]